MTYRINMVSRQSFDIDVGLEISELVDKIFNIQAECQYKNNITSWKDVNGKIFAVCSKYVESIVQIN